MMSKLISKYSMFIFILIAIAANCLNISLYLDIYNNKKIHFPDKCIRKVIRQNCLCGSTLTMVCTRAENENIDPIIKKLDKKPCFNILTRTFEKQMEITIPNEFYIVIASNTREFHTILTKLTEDHLWNPKARYVIYIKNDVRVKKVFKMLSRHYIHNVVSIHVENVTKISLYTYYPFAGDNCGTNVDAVKLGQCSDEEAVSKSFLNKVPDHKVRDKSQPCKIRIAASTHVPNIIPPTNKIYRNDGKPMLGLEQFMLEAISDDENLILEYEYPLRNNSYGTVYDNGTTTGLFTYLKDDIADIAAAGFVLTYNRATRYDYVYGHSYAVFYFLVAVSVDDDWTIVYKEFSGITWILIAVFYFIATVTLIITNRLWSRGTQENKNFALKLWGYFFANTSQTLSKDKRVRKILACWIWLTFFLSSFYNTGFYSLMTVRVNQQHVRTDRPPFESYQPCIDTLIRNLFQSTFNITFPINNEKCMDTNNLEVVAANPKLNLYSICFGNEYIYENWKYIDSKGFYKLEIWEFSSLITAQAMYVRKGYALKDLLQQHFHMLIEAGLVSYQNKLINSKAMEEVNLRKKGFKFLGISAIRIAFYVLLVAYSIALFTFVMEKCIFMCKRKSNVQVISGVRRYVSKSRCRQGKGRREQEDSDRPIRFMNRSVRSRLLAEQTHGIGDQDITQPKL